MRIGIIGATGLIGSALVKRAADVGHVVIGYSRRADREILGAEQTRSLRRYDAWDFEGLDALVVVAGVSVFGLWTPGHREAIRESRVGLMRRVRQWLEKCVDPPGVVVSASAVGIYGSRGEEVLDEASTEGGGFLAETCHDWEAEARALEGMGVRVVLPRIGFVLADRGPAYGMMRLGFGWGLGGRLGDGRQWMPWVHLEDVTRLLLMGCEREECAGPLNLVAPQPVRNAEFTTTLAEVMRRPAVMHLPAPLLRGALGEASELFLGSMRVMPTRALRLGYRFQYETVGGALKAVFG